MDPDTAILVNQISGNLAVQEQVWSMPSLRSRKPRSVSKQTSDAALHHSHWQGLVCGSLHLTIWRAVTAVLLALAIATSPRADVVVVGNDYGGVLISRLASLQALKMNDTTVEIRGDICASACTLYLGLKKACILPRTKFGFHGPSHNGEPLPQADYERLSQVVAAQYPLVLRDWFMTSGRKTLVRMQYISGQTLIDLGLTQCGPSAGS